LDSVGWKLGIVTAISRIPCSQRYICKN